MLTLILAFAACTPTDPVDTDTDTDTDADTDTAPALWLEEGRWSAAIVGVENDSCEGAITPSMAPTYMLEWTADDAFVLDDGMVAQACTLDGDAVACETYTVPFGAGTNFNVTLRVPTPSFDRISATVFERVEVIEVVCVGEGCAAHAEALGMPMPCSLDILERYER